MFNLGSFRFWRNLFFGMLGISLILNELNEGCGTIRREILNEKFRKGGIIFGIIMFGIGVITFGPFRREMAMPNILSGNYKQVEGKVCDYVKDNKNTVTTGGRIEVKESKTRKIYKFREMHVPQNLRKGDSVKMLYIRYYGSGACIEVNGIPIDYWTDNNMPMGIIVIILLLLSVPFYYFRVFIVKPIFDYKVTYAVYAYHDKYIETMKRVYLCLVLTAAVLITAVKGDYKSTWDICWGLLLAVDYAGVFYLSFLHQKQFIIMKDKFYYCNFKKRVEGELSEIESVEKTENGVIIRTKEEEMEILCTSEKYRNGLLEKLA